ncbi:MAG: hypothetical protein ABSA03_04930 [Streptosporangiaceae bacterium]
MADREQRSDMSGEDAAWRDLVARFDLLGDADETARPWPEREDLLAARSDQPRPGAGTSPGIGRAGAGDEPGAGQRQDSGIPGSSDADDDRGGTDIPAPSEAPVSDRTRIIRPAAPVQLPAVGAAGEDADDEDEHFIPPPPPPLPPLDPVAKGAWTALFGGPAYLLVATTAGWVMPGWAAFGAVAAFVGGFAVIVVRMGDKPSRGDGPDNGAVV